MTTSLDHAKQAAAEAAVEHIRSGMRVGLGTGSTARFAVAALGRKLASGELTGIVGVPTSNATEAQARALHIPLRENAAVDGLDLAIDGADEVDPQLDLIKGLGGALLREKAVEIKAERFIVIVDETKLVPKLGTKGPLPVEVAESDRHGLAAWFEAQGAQPVLRSADGAPFVTDNGFRILDTTWPDGIADAPALGRALDARVDVKAHGLFLAMASLVIVASAEGTIRMLERP